MEQQAIVENIFHLRIGLDSSETRDEVVIIKIILESYQEKLYLWSRRCAILTNDTILLKINVPCIEIRYSVNKISRLVFSKPTTSASNLLSDICYSNCSCTDTLGQMAKFYKIWPNLTKAEAKSNCRYG